MPTEAIQQLRESYQVLTLHKTGLKLSHLKGAREKQRENVKKS